MANRMLKGQFRVEKWIAIDHYVLLVYYTTARCYQFSIIDEQGKAFDFELICYTADAAEREGRAAIAYGAELCSADENLRFSRSFAADRTEFCAGDALQGMTLLSQRRIQELSLQSPR